MDISVFLISAVTRTVPMYAYRMERAFYLYIGSKNWDDTFWAFWYDEVIGSGNPGQFRKPRLKRYIKRVKNGCKLSNT